jgi:hypothetical protein
MATDRRPTPSKAIVEGSGTGANASAAVINVWEPSGPTTFIRMAAFSRL